MSGEIVILPEMLSAGEEALAEAEDQDYESKDVVIAIYLAMRVIEEMLLQRDNSGTVH